MAERKRSYRPGHRRSDLGKDFSQQGIMSESRWAWVRVAIGQFVILVDEDDNEEIKKIRLFHPIQNSRPINWVLTALTEEELLKLKELFDAAFEWALPIVRLRDKEAADAFEAGDDSHARVYRQVPQLVFRKRPVGEHGSRVLQRPEGVSDGDGRAVSRDGGVRGSGDELVEHDSEGDGPENNWPQVDGTPKLR